MGGKKEKKNKKTSRKPPVAHHSIGELDAALESRTLVVDDSSAASLRRGLLEAVMMFHPRLSSTSGGRSTFKFRALTGGVTNKLYLVECGEVRVLVRLYGRGTEDLIDRDSEVATQLALNRCGLGAAFYGKFVNGCVYEFLNGRSLTPETVGHFAVAIAEQLAKWHSAHVVEGPKRPRLWTTIRRWLGKLRPEDWDAFVVSPMQIEMELNYISERLPASPTVFCHNDALALNIVVNGDERQARFIDYEYAGYNPRGFDIGNHFWEYTGFDLELKRYPGRAHQMRFLHAYMHAINHRAPTDGELDDLYREVNQWALVSHLMWSVWAVVQARNSKIDFDYADYGNRRFDVYFRNRDAFLLHGAGQEYKFR